MGLTFEPVNTSRDIEALAALADGIWREYFPSVISPGQIDYMLEKFQSVPAVAEQLRSGYEYYFFVADGERVGYVAVRPAEGKLFLSKLYLTREQRGKGYASRAMEFLESLCREQGLSAIWLTVNRHNDGSIAVYRKKGFVVVREQVSDIGGGYVMDDYVMEKRISE